VTAAAAAGAGLAGRQTALAALHEELLGCRRCLAAGHPIFGTPVIGGDPSLLARARRVMLVGQAPGRSEADSGRPFSGPAGRTLFGWLAEVGIEEERFRRQVYIAAMTRCFPGPAPSGSGDRRPSPAELALCRPYLERERALVRPELTVLVGGMAIEALLGKLPLQQAVGRVHEREGVRYLPLPHPSGASRWNNVPEHRELRRRAVELLAESGLIEP
jgi:uracil-DNA glycosylase family 4